MADFLIFLPSTASRGSRPADLNNLWCQTPFVHSALERVSLNPCGRG